MLILLSRPVSTYSIVIALATVVIHRFLLSCPAQVLPIRRRGHASDSNEADVTPFADPVLLRAGGQLDRFPLVLDLHGRTSLER